MADDVEVTPHRGLLDVRDQAGAFADASLLPSLRRDAGNLYEAIKNKDDKTARSPPKKYRDILDNTPGASDTPPARLARLEIATAALRALGETSGTQEQPPELDGLPADLRDLTVQQIEGLVSLYVNLTLAELRQRRNALREPLWLAWLRDNERAYANLQ